jgi:hypothetical protein
MTIEKSIEKKFEEIKTIRFSIKNTFKTHIKNQHIKNHIIALKNQQ